MVGHCCLLHLCAVSVEQRIAQTKYIPLGAGVCDPFAGLFPAVKVAPATLV